MVVEVVRQKYVGSNTYLVGGDSLLDKNLGCKNRRK